MILRNEELDTILDEVMEDHKSSLEKLAGDAKDEDDKEEDLLSLHE